MGTVYVAESVADIVPVLYRDRDLLWHYGIGFEKAKVCKQPPAGAARDDFTLWVGEGRGLRALPPDATGLIRSRKTGRCGLVHGRTAADFRLLLSRWDEVEAAGGQVYFHGSVSQRERGTDDVRWVIDRLVDCHSYSLLRPVDWGKLERGVRRRIDAADSPRGHFRAWSWLFARLKDGHTKLLSLEGGDPCARLHCGLYGRFVGRDRFVVERVYPESSGEEAGIQRGVAVLGVNGTDWRTYLRDESAYWAFSSVHCARAARRFIPWYQPTGTRLELDTSEGRRTVEFAGESYPSFFHWACEGRPEPVSFRRLGPRRCRLRIAYFADGDGFVSSCRGALMAVPEGAELELDLRGNGGGNGVSGFKVAGMLLPRGAPLSRRRGRRVGGSLAPWSVYRNPDEPIYGGRLVVLMDELCASTAEMVLGALKASDRAKLRGRRSAGSSGNPRQFVSGGGVRFTCSSWEETTPEGESIEGHGVTTRRWVAQRARIEPSS